MRPSMKTIETLKLLVDVLFDADFDEVLDNNFSYEIYDWESDNQNLVDKFSLEFYHGATKICVALETEEDWIIKIPFRDRKEDYCKLELENYNKAISCGLSKYFPETYFLSDFGGKTIILQERVDCDFHTEDSIHTLLEENAREILISNNFINEHTSEYEASDKIMDYVYEMSDYEKVMAVFGDEDLAIFIKENRINDIHCANMGFKNNEPIIIDFSGFGF